MAESLDKKITEFRKAREELSRKKAEGKLLEFLKDRAKTMNINLSADTKPKEVKYKKILDNSKKTKETTDVNTKKHVEIKTKQQRLSKKSKYKNKEKNKDSAEIKNDIPRISKLDREEISIKKRIQELDMEEERFAQAL